MFTSDLSGRPESSRQRRAVIKSFLFIKLCADAKDTQLAIMVLIISEPKINILYGSEEKLTN